MSADTRYDFTGSAPQTMLMRTFHELERHKLGNGLSMTAAPGITVESQPGRWFHILGRKLAGFATKPAPSHEGHRPRHPFNTPVLITVGPEAPEGQYVARVMLKEIFYKWPCVRVQEQQSPAAR